VLPPDVNESQIDFAVVGGKIRFGLNAVKGVGELACRTIIRARADGGPFESIWDFTERVDSSVVNKRALESLVKCGALPGRGWGCSRCSSRRSLRAEAAGRPARGTELDLRRRLRGGGRRAGVQAPPARSPEEFDKTDLLKLEKETLGLYVFRASALGTPRRAAREDGRHDRRARAPPRRRVGRRRRHHRRGQADDDQAGEPMVFLRLDDVTGGIDCVVFNSTYAAASEFCRPDRIVIRQGPRRPQGGRGPSWSRRRSPPSETVALRREVRLRIDATRARAGIVASWRSSSATTPGRARWLVDCVTSQGSQLLRARLAVPRAARRGTSMRRFAPCSVSRRSPELGLIPGPRPVNLG